MTFLSSLSALFGGSSENPEENQKKAEALHQKGREEAGKGNYEAGIKLFKEAQTLAPQWPYPPYDLAYTYLLQGDHKNALKYYLQTDQLSPNGFFTCKTALWSLEKEAKGIYPKGLYLLYIEIEWAPSAEEKIKIAKKIVESHPDYAPAWKELFILLETKEEKMEALEKGLKNDPDPETKGILLANKAAQLYQNQQKKEARELLNQIIQDPQASFASKGIAKTLLENFELQ